jgi:pimeloyl-ACP methyl ester carboxylesterase
MQINQHFVDNGDGWELDLKQYVEPKTCIRERPPVVMIPGYAMNTFILGFHPDGTSMVEYLVQGGHEVWTANLRRQGDSRPRPGRARFGFAELALTDLPAVFNFIRGAAFTEPETLQAVGCSLGASLLYAYLAHHPEDHGLDAMVAIGGPLRWDATHPLMRVAFSSPRIAGAARIRGTRRLARLALPLLRRAPRLLALYMHADMVDMSQVTELVKAVEDPIPQLNREIAHWMRAKDLTVGGLNVTQGLARVEGLPLLCILGNADGIVPPAAALSVRAVLGEEAVDVLEVGDERSAFAHADLFIARQAQDQVFRPMGEWLAARGAREG